jgi:hypothetical protein
MNDDLGGSGRDLMKIARGLRDSNCGSPKYGSRALGRQRLDLVKFTTYI